MKRVLYVEAKENGLTCRRGNRLLSEDEIWNFIYPDYLSLGKSKHSYRFYKNTRSTDECHTSVLAEVGQKDFVLSIDPKLITLYMRAWQDETESNRLCRIIYGHWYGNCIIVAEK